jgi:hypothetical protein
MPIPVVVIFGFILAGSAVDVLSRITDRLELQLQWTFNEHQ